MTPERWKQIKAILEPAAELRAEERNAFIEEKCNGDDDLRGEVISLLAADNTNAALLDGDASRSILGEDPETRVGENIGNYRIIREIGVGGMGAVYLAERADGAFDQKVAIKLIKRGMDSAAILKRFVNERQILASLDHPNIARLIDGGTTADGLPFFVMEYIEAETIIEYSRRVRAGIESDLDLFLRVCSAVSFAHRNLVVHRDLKPSNILVTSDGIPKLLDFGIAKLLGSDDGLAVTATQNFAFTPEYASPEQVSGDNITTATDVYSLGVILYELLTGSRPYKTDIPNLANIIRAVCETEPSRPSSVAFASVQNDGNSNAGTKIQGRKAASDGRIYDRRALRGDLDNIILKALRKEPERRYASVEQFSEDIRRHLKGLPVTASRDTWNYRAEKFIRRNSLSVIAAGLLLLTLLGGLGATLYQRNRAERRFNDVRQLANSFVFEINDQIIKSPIKARELLIQRALEYLDKLAVESGNDPELQSELAAAYERIGDVQAEAFRPNLGKTSEAILSHSKALELREHLYAADPTTDRAVQVANSHSRLSSVLMMSGKIAESRSESQRSIDILLPLLSGEPSNYLVRRRLASFYARHGQSVLRSGSLDESLANYERSLDLFQALNAEFPEKPDVRRGVGIVFSYIGFVKMEKGQAAEAVEYYGKWLEIEKELASVDKNEPGSTSGLSTAHTWFGVALSEQNREKEAIAHLNEGVKVQQKLLALDKENFAEHTALADAHLELGKVEIKYDRTADAIKNLETALATYETVWQNDKDSLYIKHRVAASQRYLADALMQKKDPKRALDNYQRSFSAIKELTDADPNQTDWLLDLGMCYLRLGEFYLRSGQPDTASVHFKNSLPIFEKLSTATPENIKRVRDLETVRSYIDNENQKSDGSIQIHRHGNTK